MHHNYLYSDISDDVSDECPFQEYEKLDKAGLSNNRIIWINKEDEIEATISSIICEMKWSFFTTLSL